MPLVGQLFALALGMLYPAVTLALADACVPPFIGVWWPERKVTPVQVIGLEIGVLPALGYPPNVLDGRVLISRLDRVAPNEFALTALLTRRPEDFVGWTQGGRTLYIDPLPSGEYTVLTTIYVDSFEQYWLPAPCSNRIGYPMHTSIVVAGEVPEFQKAPLIEYYNVRLDHYFITQIETEIAALDTGVLAGWQRTGQSFLAWRARTPQAPGGGYTAGHGVDVCRLYGVPAAGLDTHFYSDDSLECGATVRRYPGHWVWEDRLAFSLPLINRATGKCPPNTIPVYRVWNGRADSNHRYTTDVATRQAMIEKGYVPEGYGPMHVAMCAFP